MKQLLNSGRMAGCYAPQELKNGWRTFFLVLLILSLLVAVCSIPAIFHFNVVAFLQEQSYFKYGALLLTVGPAANGIVNLPNERPQFIVVELTGGVLLTNINITGNKNGTLMNYDANGVFTIGQCQQKTQFTTTTMFPLGMGRGNESTTINVTTGAGTTCNVYGFSLCNSSAPPIVYEMTTQNATSTIAYSKFFQLGFVPSAGQTYVLQGNDGLMSPITATELRQIAGQDINQIATNVIINNIKQDYGAINITTGAAAMTVYRSYLKTA